MKKNKKKKKRTLTPLERLKRRIFKEFGKKTFIGDIAINDNEYGLLIDYFKSKCQVLFDLHCYSDNDPVFAVALVQIGIKNYDSRLWHHIAKILGMRNVNYSYTNIIGSTFIETLSSYNKVVLRKNEIVNNVLMHGFVSDHYADDMFNFLFKFYSIDLERDLQRNDKEMMDSLIEIIQRNDNTGRTYLLVRQTANAIKINTRGGRIRIRRLLRLIDKCFWENEVPANPKNRITILFKKWQEDSEDFKREYNFYHSGLYMGGGKKSFLSPYLKCDYKSISFKLILPTQLIKFEYDNYKDIKWKVCCGGEENTIDTSIYSAVTGFKTELKEISINQDDIFSEFLTALFLGDNRIKLFKIKTDCIRFFDKDGDFINPDSIMKGEVYAFTHANEIPKSEALIDNESVGKLIKSYFEFEYGDIVRLPDGKPLSIGKKIEEGLLHRKVLSSAHALHNDDRMPIYSVPPTVMLKIKKSRAIGTAIDINGNRYRLFDKETVAIDLQDRSGETGYIINLRDYGCENDGVYTLYIDAPNDRTNRLWRFALINGIKYGFEDAPYIFKLKGTITFNDNLRIIPMENSVAKNIGENSYNFGLKPDTEFLGFKYKTDKGIIEIYFKIPIFKWSFNNKKWNIEKPADIWHSHFPTIIYIKYPDDRLKLSMDEDCNNDNNEQFDVYTKSKSEELFKCDLTRFKSWFDRESIKQSIIIDLPNIRTEFCTVVTKSVVESHIIKSDFESKKFIGEFEIIGNSNYYADIMIMETKKFLQEKIPLINGRFEFFDNLCSGLYKVSVFEDEEDDTGFGISNYLLIDEFTQDIINPFDLNGKNIALRSFMRSVKGATKYNFRLRYVVCDLIRDKEDNDNLYKGKLMINTVDDTSPILFDVKVEFFDLEKLNQIYLTFFDGSDSLEFLYDYNKKLIVKNEEKGLPISVKYRRYEPLYSEDYIYNTEFTNEVPKKYVATKNIIDAHENEIVIWKDSEPIKDIHIKDMGLSIRTYNCLNRARIETAKDIRKIGTSGLFKVRNLGKTGVIEIISKMSSLGIDINNLKEESKIEAAATVEGNKKEVARSTISDFKKEDKSNDIMDTLLLEIGLSNLTLNCLKRSGVYTIKDVENLGIKRLIHVQGLKSNMREELLYKLYSFGVLIR